MTRDDDLHAVFQVFIQAFAATAPPRDVGAPHPAPVRRKHVPLLLPRLAPTSDDAPTANYDSPARTRPANEDASIAANANANQQDIVIPGLRCRRPGPP